MPTSLILLQMCFFQNSPFTFIPNFTIPFKLTYLNQIKFTNSKSPNLLHVCLHRDHHLDLHPHSIKHALPISDTRFSSSFQHPFHHCFPPSLFKSTPSYLSSNQFISNISNIPKPSFHSAVFPNHYIQADTTLVLHIHTLGITNNIIRAISHIATTP